MTPLAKILTERITAAGPISISDYMTECLLHPDHGYYATREPFGVAGDFTTAPEISQMFGELVGLCLAQHWLDVARPENFTLAELGPGRGTLMSDILRATRSVPEFSASANVHMVEASERLRAIQRGVLKGESATWTAAISDLPAGPLFLVANEFFDALPVRQFVRDKNGWREYQIGLQNGAMAQGLSSVAPIAALDDRLTDTKPGDTVELRQSADNIIAEISDRIAKHGGLALIVDYGGWHSFGDTLQAVRDHASEGILDHPGEADLTAHVDFEALANAAGGVSVTPLISQGTFLERLGITQRAQLLAQNLSGLALEEHIAAHRRLTHPNEMGTLFKVMAIHRIDSPLPPGFA